MTNRMHPPPWGATVNSKQIINRKQNIKFLIFLLFTVYCCPPMGGCIRFVINSLRICLIKSVKVMGGAFDSLRICLIKSVKVMGGARRGSFYACAIVVRCVVYAEVKFVRFPKSVPKSKIGSAHRPPRSFSIPPLLPQSQ